MLRTLVRVGMLVAACLFLVACGQAESDAPSAGAEDDDPGGPGTEQTQDEVLALCNGEGASAADGLTEEHELAAAYAAGAQQVADWIAEAADPPVEPEDERDAPSSDGDKPEGANGTGDDYQSLWRRQASQDPHNQVALCVYEAERVTAPGSPSGKTSEYRYLLVVADEGGPVHPMRAMSSESPKRRDLPEGSEQVYP